MVLHRRTRTALGSVVKASLFQNGHYATGRFGSDHFVGSGVKAVSFQSGGRATDRLVAVHPVGDVVKS